jgi:hypothetical protein
MRTKTLAIIGLTLLASLAEPQSAAGSLEGRVRVGGIILDEVGDRSAVQETYNVYDGFSLTQIRLQGTSARRSFFTVDLRDLNLDSRQGDVTYLMPGVMKVSGRYDQNRQVFDPERAVNSERKDWGVGLSLTPKRWLTLSGSYADVTRSGDRLSFPAGTASVLGTRYDNSLKAGQFTVEGQKDRRGGAVTYRISDYTDELNALANRKGQVVSARLHFPDPFFDKVQHFLRGAYGIRELTTNELDYTLANVQYTGVANLGSAWQLRYRFDANRIDNESTQLKTDRFQNDVDATYFHKYGRLNGGYGYEMNDDDHRLTSYHSWHAGMDFRHGRLQAKVHYAERVKKDQEELTLLKDVEASRIRGSLEVRPLDALVVGGTYARRDREFPDIGVDMNGDVVSGFGRYERTGWGSVGADYSYSLDEYRDLVGRFDTDSHIVTGRAEITRVKNLRLGGGVAYLDIGKDLNIEKSSIFAEGAYTILRDYQIEVQYNVYNYDDYILIDRYYTANVVRVNLVYNLH